MEKNKSLMNHLSETQKLLFVVVLILWLSVYNITVNSQVERETRGVWVATNFRLDWPPPTYDQEKQKQALINIFENIKSKNLNTVFFQVRSNGVVLFSSSFEALSPYITGEVGRNASYDPLKFAVEQAHSHGLEIHAWVNVVRCFSGTESATFNNPAHITQRKPEWIVEDVRDGAKSYWLDPGLPEVRDYLSDMFAEMAASYDIDGIHLDFIRYPGKNFDDAFSYNVYGNGVPVDDWRRSNITSLVESISRKVKSVKKNIKVGAAPIGVYKNQKGMYGWESYNEIYQDSREWLKRGIVDYLAPQIYWSLSDNTRFDLLAKEWVENSFGRHIILGIGAYKDNVKQDIGKMVDFSRSIGAEGVAFFRYSSISGYQFEKFPYKTLPSLMTWMGGIYPEPPSNLSAGILSTGSREIEFEWQISNKSPGDSIGYFAIYNLPNPGAELLPDYLLDVIPADVNNYKLIVDKPERVNYYFVVNSVSKLWNESIESSNVVQVRITELNDLIYSEKNRFVNPVLVKENNLTYKILLYSDVEEKIEIIGMKKGEKEKIESRILLKGKNIISIENDTMGPEKLKIRYPDRNREVELKL